MLMMLMMMSTDNSIVRISSYSRLSGRGGKASGGVEVQIELS